MGSLYFVYLNLGWILRMRGDAHWLTRHTGEGIDTHNAQTPPESIATAIPPRNFAASIRRYAFSPWVLGGRARVRSRQIGRTHRRKPGRRRVEEK